MSHPSAAMLRARAHIRAALVRQYGGNPDTTVLTTIWRRDGYTLHRREVRVKVGQTQVRLDGKLWRVGWLPRLAKGVPHVVRSA